MGEIHSNHTQAHERSVKELFIGKCWSYLDDNFHKFTEANKIKIALALAQKDLPTKMEGGLSFNKLPEIKVGEQPQELQIG